MQGLYLHRQWKRLQKSCKLRVLFRFSAAAAHLRGLWKRSATISMSARSSFAFSILSSFTFSSVNPYIIFVTSGFVQLFVTFFVLVLVAHNTIVFYMGTARRASHGKILSAISITPSDLFPTSGRLLLLVASGRIFSSFHPTVGLPPAQNLKFANLCMSILHNIW